MVNFGNELCDVALAGENITNLKCLGLFCSLGNFFWVVYNDTGYIDIWVITLFMGLYHWIWIWSHWLHLNLVPTRLCVFSKCFWVVSWSHCSHLNSLDKACVAKVLDQKMFFSINRNHQDEITFNKISTYWAPLFVHLFCCFLSHWSKLYLIHSCWLQVEILFLNCFSSH